MKKTNPPKDPFALREAAKYKDPIPSREYILQHLLQRKEPASYKDLLKELNLTKTSGKEALQKRLRAMLRDGQLEKLREEYVWPVGNRISVEGRVVGEKNGSGWVVPIDGSERIFLSRTEMRTTFPGNRVIASVPNLASARYREGRIVEILEQPQVTLVGRFVEDKDDNYVISHNREFTQDILIPKEKASGAVSGDIVVVELLPARYAGETIGQITEILGNENTSGIEVEAVARAYKLPQIWPDNIKKALDIPTTIPVDGIQNRVDLRSTRFVTIDGEDAKDFDDAVFCEKRNNGGWRLFVAIADVSYYVENNSALDKEALSRGNSVYFPGKVIPMLPEVLSNELCSLKPEVDRLSMVCELDITETGKVTQYQFYEAVIRSHARLTYTKVAAILEKSSEKLAKQYEHLLEALFELQRLYHVLKTERETRGAIEFETIETRIVFGKEGKISRIEPIERNEAHRIIEECMLCANVATARFLNKHKVPGLYRNHEGPTAEKLADLRLFLNELGIKLNGGKTPKPLDYATLLRSIQNRPDAHIIQSVLLRSLSQAVYAPDNLGHFGLAYPAYCHFTSPIRRYPDLLVHRQIKEVLQGQWDEEKTDAKKLAVKRTKDTETLIAIGTHCSMTERRADDATRDTVRWLKCEYMQKHIGETFSGVVSGVTRFGFFVELKGIFIDGLVHIATLENDYYYFDPIHHRLLGERTGTVYKLGDIVTVRVGKVNVDERKIDFDLLDAKIKKTAKNKFKKRTKTNTRTKQKPNQKTRKPKKKRRVKE